MTTVFGYSSYSREYGTFVGIGWGALFLLYIYSVLTMNPLFFLAFFALMFVCSIMPFFFAFRINKKYASIGERLSYFQGFSFSLVMFMYACLMSGIISYIYFEFFDNGAICQSLLEMFNTAELKKTYEHIGMSDSYNEMMQLLNEASSLSSFEKTLALFNNNFFMSLFLSFLVAFVASFSTIRQQNRNQLDNTL